MASVCDPVEAEYNGAENPRQHTATRSLRLPSTSTGRCVPLGASWIWGLAAGCVRTAWRCGAVRARKMGAGRAETHNSTCRQTLQRDENARALVEVEGSGAPRPTRERCAAGYGVRTIAGAAAALRGSRESLTILGPGAAARADLLGWSG